MSDAIFKGIQRPKNLLKKILFLVITSGAMN
jgi:hypothetical protein